MADGRAQLDPEHVARLSASDPQDWPPLLVRPETRPEDDKRYTLVGGWHRFYVARDVFQLTALPCRIDPDADIVDAFRDNMRHGLPVSIADRKAYAVLLYQSELEETGKAPSFRAIGREAGLSQNTVIAALRSVQNEQPADTQSTGASWGTKPEADEVKKLVRLVMKADADKTGQSWLGRVFSNKTPAQQTAEYISYVCRDMVKAERYPEAAKALAALGESFTLAAERVRTFKPRSE